jgi:hypothetical protein
MPRFSGYRQAFGEYDKSDSEIINDLRARFNFGPEVTDALLAEAVEKKYAPMGFAERAARTAIGGLQEIPKIVNIAGTSQETIDKLKERKPELAATLQQKRDTAIAQLKTVAPTTPGGANYVPPATRFSDYAADFIGNVVADLPLVVAAGGAGGAIAKRIGLQGAKATLTSEALSGALYSQMRPFEDERDRLSAALKEAALWSGMAGAGLAYRSWRRTRRALRTGSGPLTEPEKADVIETADGIKEHAAATAEAARPNEELAPVVEAATAALPTKLGVASAEAELPRSITTYSDIMRRGKPAQMSLAFEFGKGIKNEDKWKALKAWEYISTQYPRLVGLLDKEIEGTKPLKVSFLPERSYDKLMRQAGQPDRINRISAGVFMTTRSGQRMLLIKDKLNPEIKDYVDSLVHELFHQRQLKVHGGRDYGALIENFPMALETQALNAGHAAKARYDQLMTRAGDVAYEDFQRNVQPILKQAPGALEKEAAGISVAANKESAPIIQHRLVKPADALGVTYTDPVAQRVEASFDSGSQLLSEAKKRLKQPLYERLKYVLIDTSANVKDALLSSHLSEASKAVRMKDLVKGYTAAADQYLRRAKNEIFAGMNEHEREYLGRFQEWKRTMQVEAKNPNIQSPRSGADMTVWADDLAQSNPQLYDKLMTRGRMLDQVYKDMLDMLKQNGLLGDEGYQRMLADGPYSGRREFIEYLDDFTTVRGGGKVSVADSGLKRLKEGNISELERDPEELLNQYVTRVYSKVFKNKANQALWELADQVPTNGIVSKLAPGHAVPHGYERINVMKDGQTHSLIMPNRYASEWIMSDPMIDSQLANIVGLISGSKVLKAMATGLNPGFAVTNFPRDLAHIWLTTHEYSKHGPVALLQIGKDLATVAKDAFTRGQRYRDYITEGGGMSFLTHQGRAGKMAGVWGHIQEYLGYVGESSEIWTRLALRERALRNGADPTKATWIARTYLDFGQGGAYTKAVDNAIPYLNAAVQGTRGLLRSAKSNPAEFTYKTAQLMGLAAGLYMANRTQNPDAWNSISDSDKKNYFIITTPHAWTDKDGNTRHYYFRIAKDQSQRVMAAVAEGLMAKFNGDPVKVSNILGAIKDAAPLWPTELMPPVIEAIMSYASNKDFWRNEDIWRGPKVIPREEYTNYTPESYVALGQLTGASPERTKKALGVLFTDGNIYTDMVGGGLNALLRDLPEPERKKVLTEQLSNIPILKRVAKSTNPGTLIQDAMKQAQVEADTEKYKRSRVVDELVYRYAVNKSPEEMSRLQQFLATQTPDEKKRLTTRAKNSIKFSSIPDRRWWLDLQDLEPVTRARMYWQKYSAVPMDKKREMAILMSRLPGIKSTKFLTALNRLRAGKELK